VVSSMKRTIITILAGATLVGGLLLFANQRQAPAEVRTDRTTREVALACDPEMGQAYHIHPVLTILVRGEQVPIPNNVGIRENCMTVIHTHSSDGVIHVESPETRDFTLGDFFAVWEQPFSKDELMTHKVDAGSRIRVTVDGQEVDTYETTLLRDGQQIVISYEPI
jgi:hypothetical protein